MPVQKHRSDNLGLSVVPAIKNGSENIKMRDFAEETLPKNGCDKMILDPEIFCEMRDFAADTLAKNGTDQNFTPDTLSDPNLKKIILPEIEAVFLPDRYFRADTLISPFFKPEKTAVFDHAEKQPVSLISLFFAKFDIKQFLKSKNFNNLKKTKFYFQFHQFWPITGLSHVHKNLGGRGHRFSMTLESRISRFRKL